LKRLQSSFGKNKVSKVKWLKNWHFFKWNTKSKRIENRKKSKVDWKGRVPNGKVTAHCKPSVWGLTSKSWTHQWVIMASKVAGKSVSPKGIWKVLTELKSDK